MNGRALLFILPILVFSLMPAYALTTSSYCPSANTLNTSTYVYVNSSLISTTENVTCPYGCVGSGGEARCNNNPGLMPIELYLFFGGIVFLFLILSFVNFDGKKLAVFPWVALAVCAFLALASSGILIDGEQFESANMVYFWGGLSVLILALAIYLTFFQVEQDLSDIGKMAGA